MKKLHYIPYSIALLLSYIMSIVISCNYVSLLYCGKYEGCSAPASTAFLYLLPFCVAIMICIIIGHILQKKHLSKK